MTLGQQRSAAIRRMNRTFNAAFKAMNAHVSVGPERGAFALALYRLRDAAVAKSRMSERWSRGRRATTRQRRGRPRTPKGGSK